MPYQIKGVATDNPKEYENRHQKDVGDRWGFHTHLAFPDQSITPLR